MGFKVKYSQQSSADLTEIIRYINDELFSPQAAERFLNEVTRKTDLLSENPYLFPIYQDEKLVQDGYRFIAIGNYLLFYIVDDINTIVNIVRIIYGKRNIPAVFGEMGFSAQ
jgi:addiction module RelE/StbE family toxin